MKKLTACLALVLAALVAAPALAQDHGSGGGVGCGDVFGDLIEIKRAPDTGQPILQKRWVELPKEVPGYGWGYCKIALDKNGSELPFAPLSCDIHPDYVDQIVPVDYFGRLNGGRTKEKNHRMHFNEVISTIMLNFIEAIAENEPSLLLTPPEVSLESHLMAFAAERSRRRYTVEEIRL